MDVSSQNAMQAKRYESKHIFSFSRTEFSPGCANEFERQMRVLLYFFHFFHFIQMVCVVATNSASKCFVISAAFIDL